MTWTYTSTSSTFLASSLGVVRRRVGDTDTSDQLMTDEEINSEISSAGTTLLASRNIAKSLAAKFARRMDSKMGKLDLKNSQMFEHYTALAEELDLEIATGGATPWAGAPSKADKETQQLDTDRVEPAFARGMFAVEQTAHGETMVTAGSTE